MPACISIAIHALLAESDDEGTLECLRAFRISIHALLAESDIDEGTLECLRAFRFLSTLSLRRATASHTNLPGEN